MGIATITVKSYCAVNYCRVHEGSKEDVVRQACKFWFDNNRLFYQFDGYQMIAAHSYSSEYTNEQRYKDAVNFLFSKLPKLGYKIYKEI
jgi:hypothetical protein